MSDALHNFSARVRPGDYIAALKVYLAVAAYSDFRSWTATLSLSDLEEITKVSRPTLIRGVDILVREGLILKGRARQTSTYQMVIEEERTSWAKVPQDIIRQGLRSIPNRGRYPLAALRCYILFLTLRDSTTSESRISYQRVTSYTGVRTADIALGLNILIVSGFINVRQAQYNEDENAFPHNIYILKGDFGGSTVRHMRPRPRALRVRLADAL